MNEGCVLIVCTCESGGVYVCEMYVCVRNEQERGHVCVYKACVCICVLQRDPLSCK